MNRSQVGTFNFRICRRSRSKSHQLAASLRSRNRERPLIEIAVKLYRDDPEFHRHILSARDRWADRLEEAIAHDLRRGWSISAPSSPDSWITSKTKDVCELWEFNLEAESDEAATAALLLFIPP